MSWLEKLLPTKIQPTDPNERRTVPEGLWIKCPSCETVLYKTDLEQNVNVCPKCGQHHRISARARLDAFLDAEGRYEIGQEVLPVDALKFKDSRKYPERLKIALEQTGETDALIVMGGAVLSIPVVAACFEFDFMGGSMGSVVGERFARGVETACEQKTPFISFASSGGARMQEGLLSLMQMAKTNASLTRLAKARLPYISVLTDPTMGGVSASFAFVVTFKRYEKIDHLLTLGLNIAKQGLKTGDVSCKILVIQYYGYLASSNQLQKKNVEAIKFFEKQGDAAFEFELPVMSIMPYHQAYTLSKRHLSERYDELIQKAFNKCRSLSVEELLNSSFSSIAMDYLQWIEAKQSLNDYVKIDNELSELLGRDWKEKVKNPTSSYPNNTTVLTP